MAALENFNLKTTFDISETGETIELDFSNRRFTNRMLHLIKKYRSLDDTIEKKTAEAEKIEDSFDRMLALSDIQVDILEEFRADVDEAFGTNITEKMFGVDCLPSIERYMALFDMITPYIEASYKNEEKLISKIKTKYSAKRLDGDA